VSDLVIRRGSAAPLTLAVTLQRIGRESVVPLTGRLWAGPRTVAVLLSESLWLEWSCQPSAKVLH